MARLDCVFINEIIYLLHKAPKYSKSIEHIQGSERVMRKMLMERKGIRPKYLRWD